MRIEKSKGRRPIEFKKIYQGSVFSYNDKYFMKGRYGDDDCAVDLENGEIINPYAEKGSFQECILYPESRLVFRKDKERPEEPD